jgi:hypothetical protein
MMISAPPTRIGAVGTARKATKLMICQTTNSVAM